ncbi:cytoplasmic dynein 2 heavy chain 1 [Caerostris extrusa]|uniref:Cytoplasmic dynein 2 heavy chain 1 n=1 Tax=Caerostris extrusa TaxID=172846 RepID=A0AAV4XEL7_CAEEX|nr:cytoplasmic dynein 2 heavy chain 1 [Caerostris extrusa]
MRSFETYYNQHVEENIKLSKRKKDIDLELKEIEPIVQEAKSAVGNIKSEALSEIRSLRAPPDVIRDILEGVLRLMEFLTHLGIQNLFDSKNAKRASAAAAPLAAGEGKCHLFQGVGKDQAIGKEQGKLKHTALEDVEEEVSVLRDRLNKFTKEAAQIEINLKQANETIASAETLVSKLDDEYRRWTFQLQEIDQQLEELPMKALLAAAFITYLSAEPEDERRSVVEKWCSEFGIEKFSLTQTLSTEREQLVWKNEGLPSDELSVENAICILHNTLVPFLIDPSFQAANWLKANMVNSQLEVINCHDSNFLTSVEMAVRFGKTLLLQDVDTIHPVLYPLLRRDLINQGPRYVVQIGEKVVDYNPQFKLFLVTKYSEIELPPNFYAVVSTVNFSTTKAGLTGQLLATVLQREKPELELKTHRLVTKRGRNEIAADSVGRIFTTRISICPRKRPRK